MSGLNIKKMLGGALAAAAGYLGVRAVINGIDTLGRMSDMAMKASTSVDELTQASTALNILGIQGMGIDRLAQAFALMAKNTGKTGLSGFYEMIGELGKIQDVSKRTEAAMKVFGKAGIEFMPLINAAKDGTQSLQTLIDAMPKVPQVAADAGDALSDAKTIGVEGFKNLWLEAIASISQDIDDKFQGGIRQAALDGVAYFSFFVKASWTKLTGFFTAVSLGVQGLGDSFTSIFSNLFDYYKSFFGAVGKWIWDVVNVSWDDIKSNGVFGKANSNFTKAMDKAAAKLTQNIDFEAIGDSINKTDSKLAELRRNLDNQLTRNEKATEAYNLAAKSTGDRLREDNTSGVMKSKAKIDNKLILGGSNEATKLALLGPQTQQEMKKQTNILKEIRDNTKQTATNTDNIGDGYDDLTELN